MKNENNKIIHGNIEDLQDLQEKYLQQVQESSRAILNL
jgi:hypothetical protein